MGQLIVAAFDSWNAANEAEVALHGQGIPGSMIRRYQQGDPAAPTVTSPTATTGQFGTTETATPPRAREEGGFFSWLFGEDTTARTDYDETEYQGHLSAKRTILAVHAENDQQDALITETLTKYAAVGIDKQPDSGTPTTGQTTATARTPEQTAPGTIGTTGRETEEVIPLAKENVDIGKRQVVEPTRVRRYTIERPVEKAIPLRDETVTVQRRRAQGNEAPGGAFEERTTTVETRREVPDVKKTAGVNEEVVIKKEARDHTETVRETERQEQVEVDKGTRGTDPKVVLPEATDDKKGAERYEENTKRRADNL